MKKWKQVLLAFAVMTGVGATALPATGVSAINVFKQCGANSDSDVCQAEGTDDATKMIKTVINTMLFILGTIAVIMIIVGGIRYTTSGGDASGVKSAKDTVLYSVVGLVVALMSYAIVNFVVGRF